MICFGGLTIRCSAALLEDTAIDAASFTAIRMVSARGDTCGSSFLCEARCEIPEAGGRRSRYCVRVTFSYAYTALTAGTGALILFGAVQATMLAFGLIRGERLGAAQLAGIVLALAGLTGLLSRTVGTSLAALCSCWPPVSHGACIHARPRRGDATQSRRATSFALRPLHSRWALRCSVGDR